MYFGQIIVKSTQFGQNWVLSFENGILMGGNMSKKLVLRKSDFPGLAGTSRYDFDERNPPPPPPPRPRIMLVDRLTKKAPKHIFPGMKFTSFKQV